MNYIVAFAAKPLNFQRHTIIRMMGMRLATKPAKSASIGPEKYTI
jgi:hypothetical protein